MKDNHNISFDEQIKSAFEGVQMEPPAGVWESVSSQIGTQAVVAGKAVVVKSILSKIVAVAVMGAAAAGAYWGITSNPAEKAVNPEMEQVKIQEEISSNQEGISESENTAATEMEEINSGAEKISVSEKPVSSPSKEEKNPSKSNYPFVANKNAEPQSSGIGQPDIPVLQPQNPSLILYQPDSNFCIDETIEIMVRGAKFFNQVQWVCEGAQMVYSDPVTAKLKYEKEGVYVVKLIATSGRISVMSTRKLYISNPTLKVTAKTETGKIVLNTTSSKFNRYSWMVNGEVLENENSSSLRLNTSNYPAIEKLNIQVKGIKNQYCEAASQVEVALPKSVREPFVPNVFTPTEKDGKNDCFAIEIEQPEFYYLIIKNRAGKVVFESNNPTESWNGKWQNNGADCQPDGYFYQFIYKLKGADKVIKNGRLQLF